MDKGYNNWLTNKKEMNRLRFKLLKKMLVIAGIILALVFFFGYGDAIPEEKKLMEFASGSCGVLILLVIIAFVKYPPRKYIPCCNKCGNKIKNIHNDCEITDIKYLGTIDKTVYETKSSNIKGKTVYPRGGYSMRVSEYEHYSESSYEIRENVPVVKKYYLYDVTYSCKNCHEIFVTKQEESLKPRHERKGR